MLRVFLGKQMAAVSALVNARHVELNELEGVRHTSGHFHAQTTERRTPAAAVTSPIALGASIFERGNNAARHRRRKWSNACSAGLRRRLKRQASGQESALVKRASRPATSASWRLAACWQSGASVCCLCCVRTGPVRDIDTYGAE